jgi:predicted ATPase
MALEVPEAGDLDRVRRVVDAVHRRADVSSETGLSARQVNYHVQAARVLGWLARENRSSTVTPLGERLLGTQAGSADETLVMRESVAQCPLVSEVVPGLLSGMTVEAVIDALEHHPQTALAHATARKRALPLLHWATRVAPASTSVAPSGPSAVAPPAIAVPSDPTTPRPHATAGTSLGNATATSPVATTPAVSVQRPNERTRPVVPATQSSPATQTLSKEVRLLARNWSTGNQWPRRLQWLEINGIRGWSGQRIEFGFPIVAICGENGVGKSTVLQAAVSVYRSPAGQPSYFASQFFPDTPWDKIQNASIKYSVREGQTPREDSVRKPTTRWLGNLDRRERAVRYLDLRRTQPIVVQRGFQKLIKTGITEAGSAPFEPDTLDRYSRILGRPYTEGRHSWTSAGASLRVAVVGTNAAAYSGFHQGAGESTIAELLGLAFPRYALIAIDEVETSLHPRAQRRLIRDLAHVARIHELQVLLTTHSPYVLEELPPEARVYVTGGGAPRAGVKGISAEFAMTNMDDESHPEAEIYVEDVESERVVRELLIEKSPDTARRVMIVAAGAASVVQALGSMVQGGRFPRPTAAILDGDQSPAPGCLILPGGDAPERVVIEQLRERGFPGVATALARSHTQLTDAVDHALTLSDHHDWVPHICDRMLLARAEFWGACVRQWVRDCLSDAERTAFVQGVVDRLQLP